MNILVIAPHADDEILGVGGTIAKHIAEGNHVYVCIATRGCLPLFDESICNTIREETYRAHKMLGIKETFFLELPAVMLENEQRFKINEKIYDVMQTVKPDIIYIPHFGDMQKDHEIIAESAMVAVRPKYEHKVRAVYAYETLSETEWNIPHVTNTFIPNMYNDVSDYLKLKINAMQIYASQLSDFPNPRSVEAIEALAKYRGSTINVKAAEAFAVVRLIL